jgi:hypothetical protein
MGFEEDAVPHRPEQERAPAERRLPLPANETARLRALWSYEVLDTPPEPTFDSLTRLAAQICATPVALISLVVEGRQWF